MAVEKIDLNNQLFTPDENGVIELPPVLTEHQSLDMYMTKGMVRFVSASEWEQVKDNPEEGVFYFVGR